MDFVRSARCGQHGIFVAGSNWGFRIVVPSSPLSCVTGGSIPLRRMGTKGLSERQALQVMRMSASALRYQRAPDRNAGLRERIVELAHRHRRYGAGMIYLKLRQAGELVNHKRVDRLYALEKLQVRRRRRKKVPVSDRQPLVRPEAANPRFALGPVVAVLHASVAGLSEPRSAPGICGEGGAQARAKKRAVIRVLIGFSLQGGDANRISDGLGGLRRCQEKPYTTCLNRPDGLGPVPRWHRRLVLL